MAKAASFLGVQAKKANPTLKHRPAIWEGMLGAVYAMDDSGVTKYFHYDYEEAKNHAGVANKVDPRLARVKSRKRWSNGDCVLSDPPVGKLVLWVEKPVE